MALRKNAAAAKPEGKSERSEKPEAVSARAAKAAVAKPKGAKAQPKLDNAAAPKAKSAQSPVGKSDNKEKGNADAYRLKTILDAVGQETGAAKKVVKELTESVLRHLGTALQDGKEVNLPGFGRTKLVKTVVKAGTPTLTLKLKRISEKNSKAGDQPLADDGEDG